MRAAVLNGPESLEVIDKPKPEPAGDEVLIRVEYCGICGSDLHAYKSGLFPFGMTIGHEYAGTIEATGAGAKGFKKGDRVTGTASLSCKQCFSCQQGRDNICEAMNIIGVTREGAMAEYLVVSQESIVPLPADLPTSYGALAEPYSVALHGANLVKASKGQSAVILGSGAIGLSLLAELKRREVEPIIVADLNSMRLAAARQMGATAAVNIKEESLDNIVRDLTAGAGVDYVFECVGIPDTIREASNLVRQGGSVVILGICEIPVDIFFLGLVTREIQLRTSYGATEEEFREALAIIAADPEILRPLAEKVIPMEQLAQEGFAPLLERDSKDIKILVKMN